MRRKGKTRQESTGRIEPGTFGLRAGPRTIKACFFSLKWCDTSRPGPKAKNERDFARILKKEPPVGEAANIGQFGRKKGRRNFLVLI